MDANYTFQEIYEEICEKHLRDKFLAYKVLRQGYYWPTMKKDAAELIRRCESYQKYANIQHQSISQLTSIIAPWPFT